MLELRPNRMEEVDQQENFIIIPTIRPGVTVALLQLRRALVARRKPLLGLKDCDNAS